MDHLLSRINIAHVAITLFLSIVPLASSYAAAGCCSDHGGVSGCNTRTNHQTCKDGTTSPTCLCAKPEKSAKGCCANHGGVAKCVSGYQMCKDGTRSSTCKC